MVNFETARVKMVESQIRATDVTSHPVISAFLSVPREAFVAAENAALAYIDEDIQITAAAADAPARYLMEPSPLAKLLQLLEVTKSDVVMVVGSCEGYATAILSLLANSVVAVESDEALAASSSEKLTELGYDNAAVVCAPLEDGYAPEAPYDAIFVNGAVEFVPDAILSQLRDGGRLVSVVGYGHAARARLYRRDGENFSELASFNAAVKPLPGFRKARAFEF
ncbi:protein-L-isoaspartate O-methyltransferase [Martelella alba]|uniref:Protein-L-isoaspartate O-methyltransferase n=1 Tax=Martelella alba TaxID=2590451 RepID=A0A506UI83_9HYPH|nr:protein-L-isoaspartate O-methyltransferase [Martelella alba]TPW32993.1 protein-L-isoaspartate O-methyltransferase [Martelella alba]